MIKYFIFDKNEIDLEDEETFEESLIKKYCKENSNYEIKYYYKFPENKNNIIPIGSVKWCEQKYKNKKPDFYPKFLQKLLHRNIWKTTYKELYNSDKLKDIGIFIKPCNNYKKWNGFILKPENLNNQIIEDDEEIYCSDVIDIINEWRYYIINGEVQVSAWYDGKITDEMVINGLSKYPPQLPLNIQNKLKLKKFYGVIDIGEILINNKLKLILIEMCHPYAIGWYLEEDSYNEYANFIIKSDEYLSR
jgi:hypothetical protein